MHPDTSPAPEGREFLPRTITRWRRILWTFAALLLATPWMAMQWTDDVQWGREDFLVFGAMLAVAGGLVEGAVRLSRRRHVVLGAVIVVGAAFVLLWVELAVGLFH